MCVCKCMCVCVCVCREGQGEGSIGDLREYQIQLFHFLGEEMKIEKAKDIHLDRLPSFHFPTGVQVSLNSWVLKRGVKLSCHRPSIN